MTAFKEMIYGRLTPLIGKKCILIDAPYYPNIGDSLIWEGFEMLVKENDLDCKYRSSANTFTFPHIDNDTTIVFTGGGNFGDLWRGLQDFRCKVIKHYPNNRIVILPQSVNYNNKAALQDDIRVFSSHNDLHICARDNWSFEYLKKNFPGNNVMLLPDLAFALNAYNYTKSVKYGGGNKVLYLVRDDKESVNYPEIPCDTKSDWPVMDIDNATREKLHRQARIRHKVLRMYINLFHNFSVAEYVVVSSVLLIRIALCDNLLKKWQLIYVEYEYLDYLSRKYPGKVNLAIDWVMYRFHLPTVVKLGFDFVNRYDIVYSSRLHAGIVGFLLGKQTFLLDNANHKIINLYETWLNDAGNITMFKS